MNGFDTSSRINGEHHICDQTYDNQITANGSLSCPKGRQLAIDILSFTQQRKLLTYFLGTKRKHILLLNR